MALVVRRSEYREFFPENIRPQIGGEGESGGEREGEREREREGERVRERVIAVT